MDFRDKLYARYVVTHIRAGDAALARAAARNHTARQAWPAATHGPILADAPRPARVPDVGRGHQGSLALLEARPALRGLARVGAWRLLRAAAQAARLVETGKRQRVWTGRSITLARRVGPPS